MEDRRYHFDSFDRVRNKTSPYVNDRIDRKTESRIAYYNRLNDFTIAKQIAELDHEWDIDRALMANFSILGGAALALSFIKNRKWSYLLGVQLTFLLHHALKGWCPPVPVLRRMEFRTKTEIESEKFALRSILESRSSPIGIRRAG